MNNAANLLGRFGLSLIFIVSGWGKIGGYAGTQQYMEAMGVPGALLPLVIRGCAEFCVNGISVYS